MRDLPGAFIEPFADVRVMDIVSSDFGTAGKVTKETKRKSRPRVLGHGRLSVNV